MYMNLAKFEEAAKMYKLALENRPDLKTMYRKMIYQIMQKYKDDEESYEIFQVAYNQYNQGLSEEDCELYDNEIVQNFSRTSVEEAELLFKYGLSLEMSGDWESAEENYLRGLKLNPGFSKLSYQLASLYIKKNQWENAHKYLKITLRNDPYNKQAKELLKRLERPTGK